MIGWCFRICYYGKIIHRQITPEFFERYSIRRSGNYLHSPKAKNLKLSMVEGYFWKIEHKNSIFMRGTLIWIIFPSGGTFFLLGYGMVFSNNSENSTKRYLEPAKIIQLLRFLRKCMYWSFINLVVTLKKQILHIFIDW